MARPFFSVLMPVWDRPHLVGQAIQSIVDQSFEDWELVVVDDFSEDNTLEVVSRYKFDDKVRIIELEKHKGLVEALTIGNVACQGKVIVKQDSDDLSFPNRLQRIYDYFKKNPKTDFFYHGIYQVWETEESTDIRRAYIPALPIERKRILKEQYIPGAFAYTKEFIKRLPYRELHCSEDWMLILDAYLSGAKIGYLNEGLYDCMLRPDSNSLMHENTGHYEEDEKTIREVLRDTYGIINFNYAKRK